MLDAVSSGTLVRQHSTRYTASTWVLQYQADVRARLEHLERMQHRGASLLAAGAPDRPFDAKRPRDWALRAVIKDQAFWAEELKEPAVLVLARATRMSDWLDGDAAVRGGGGTARATSGGGAGAAHPAAERLPQRQHHVGVDGMLTAASCARNGKTTRMVPC